MRRLIVVFTLIVLFGQVNIASAREILQGDTCTIAADTTITGDVFVACQQLIVDGLLTDVGRVQNNFVHKVYSIF